MDGGKILVLVLAAVVVFKFFQDRKDEETLPPLTPGPGESASSSTRLPSSSASYR